MEWEIYKASRFSDINLKSRSNTFFTLCCSIRIGSQTFVTMCNYKTMKEAFSRYEFIDRPDWKCLNFLSDGEMAGKWESE